jgi:hypothetical protein
MTMRIFLLLLTVTALTSGQVAECATLRVPADYPTIWEAIDAAAFGDSVLVGPGHWTDTDTRLVHLGSVWQTITSCGFLKGGLTVIGEEGAEATIVDGGGGDPPGFLDTFILANQPEGDAVLEGLTITGAGIGATAIFAAASPRLVVRECRLDGNEPGEGGFVIQIDNCDFLGEDTEFRSNVAHECLSIIEASIEVYRCRFVQNECGGIRGGGQGESAIVTDCEFIDNRDECTAGARLGPLMDPVIVEGNLFVRNNAWDPSQCAGGALAIGTSSGRVAFNTFAFDSAAGGAGALQVSSCASIKVANNTFYGCDAPLAAAVAVSGTSTAEFTGNIVSHSTGGPAMYWQSGGVTGGCNDYWANEGGNFYNWVPDPTDFFEDPLFCGPEQLDLTLEASSPCVEGNTPGCPQVGAWGVGCGTVSIEPMSWGRIKDKYREERR